jgi:acetyl-CoA acyltransferase
MNSAVVIDCCRTPIGRSHPDKGFFRDVRGDDLAAAVLRDLVRRTGIDPQCIEDVVLGCTQQRQEQGLNIARMASLLAGLPTSTAGTTVNRLCGSGLQAVQQAAHAIVAGGEEVQIVGGVEHMHHLPMDADVDFNPKLALVTSKAALHMGYVAEFLAQSHGISRRQQDEFALASHQRAARATAEGAFQPEIVPLLGVDPAGDPVRVTTDQGIRADASLEALAALPPAFLPEVGSVTAGNSSPRNDGAAALLMTSERRARELGLRPLVRIRATAVAGVDPCLMGTGPVPAVRKALRRAGLTLDQIGLVELNEAFAAQVLACRQLLDLDPDRLNVRGGALALGHPLGASGARIATTLIRTMVDREVRFGLATMCVGLGQGIAVVLERYDA